MVKKAALKVLCLTDFPVKPPDRWLWNYLPGTATQVDFLSTSSRDVSKGVGKLVTRYPAFLYLAQEAQAQAKKTHYDIIVAWESKVGLPLSLLWRFRRVKSPPLVILAFAAKPPFTTAFGFFARWLLRDTHIAVPSEWEASWYVRQLGIDGGRVKVCPLGSYDVMKVVVAQRVSATTNLGRPYIFAGGRTERDYKTLAQAVTEMDIRTVINTRRYMVKGISSPNIEINDILPSTHYYGILAGASVVVLPLRKVQHAIGLSVAIDSMAAGRPLVCTDLPVLREYVIHGITGILVPPGDAGALRDAIKHLIEHPAEAEAMGKAARQRYEACYTFESFARRAYEIIVQVAKAA